MMIYQIKIEIEGIIPSVWRRILVNTNILLVDFHRVIQSTMGWTNSHLHYFGNGKIIYSPQEFEIEGSKNSRKISLNKVLKEENCKILYRYDLGDRWDHQILLEKIILNNEITTPICLDGKNNCPPEDCGGVQGYKNLRKILSNSKNKNYKYTIEWLGGKFDPKEFDLGKVNQLLHSENFGCDWYDYTYNNGELKIVKI